MKLKSLKNRILPLVYSVVAKCRTSYRSKYRKIEVASIIMLKRYPEYYKTMEYVINHLLSEVLSLMIEITNISLRGIYRAISR